MEQQPMVKENLPESAPLATRWLAALVLLTGGALLLAAQLDAALPPAREPDPRRPHDFSGIAAHRYLANLTAIGPRVAGSYENEVWTVRTLVEALRDIAGAASPHNVLELDRHEGAGAFSLTFFDGMNNVYRGVQSVLARVRGVGGDTQPALLLNCHFDTVPDSPGASDDGAGCAVLLELARALAASPLPLRHPVIFLFNGAEENIMQGSHSFVTSHPWARSVRLFLNLEACGAGGREVVFQAGPHDPWLMDTYARVVPRPFASSLAQELFESGLLPGDTDFRVFRDFGKLSGLDFAWSANGYVYHTALDTAARVPAAALQRTGDNVLALTRGLLESAELARAADPRSRQPVFFDVLGLVLVLAHAPLALAAAALCTLAVLLNVHAHAHQARRRLYIGAGEWWRAAALSAASGAAGGAAGVLAAAAAAAALGAADARLAFYSRPWLLAPLAALPAITVSWVVALWSRARGPWWGGRGWWGARAARDGQSLLGAAALLLCAALRLRSGYLPLVAVLAAAVADRLAIIFNSDKRGDGVRATLWAASAALPVLQSWYLLLALLATLAPVAGRAGTPPVPADVLVMCVTGAVSQWAAAWLLPFVLAARRPRLLIWLSAAVSAVTLALVAAGPLYAPYSAERPQRLFVLHARRTLHAPLHAPPAPPAHEDLFWVPELDANTDRTLRGMAAEIGTEVLQTRGECARRVYCGAPYYLPVRRLVARGRWLPAAAPPAAALEAALRLQDHNASVADLHIQLTGPNHVVVIVSPTQHTEVSWLAVAGAGSLAPLRALPWQQQQRDTYFVALHSARPDHPAHWNLTLTLRRDAAVAEHPRATDGARWASLSVSGHTLSAGRVGDAGWRPAHAALAAAAPPHTAVTGWGVHTHFYTV
ncbi:endoplasmic reticulum metallopeptidase 1-like isoform X2 [Plodia interpunctella]|uniref:endoplasmic reticulum metallopeptidase 1-like isoform X2 n=1 Tax=Plodia interpunctella TaxID=58824 RepID=UPI0023681DC2|nr:endoplasmic reticulum metallopeptidase 1-like isoform X2 [Plodia interpunctella]